MFRWHRLLPPLVLTALLGACAPPVPKGPADPQKLEITLNAQPTTLGMEAVGCGVMAERPWTDLRYRSYTGDSASVWLPGALLAVRFQFPTGRPGVLSQDLFWAYLMRAADWDSLRAGGRADGIDELHREWKWVALFRPTGANPYAAGTPDAARWESFRLGTEVARSRIRLVTPEAPAPSFADTLELPAPESAAPPHAPR